MSERKSQTIQLWSARYSEGAEAKIAVVDDQVDRLWEQLRIFERREKVRGGKEEDARSRRRKSHP